MNFLGRILCRMGRHRLAPFSAWTHWEDDDLPPYRWCERCDHKTYTYGPITVVERTIRL